MPADQRPAGPRERVEGAGPRRPDRLRVRRGGDVQPRGRRAERAARRRPGRRRRSASSTPAGSAKGRCGSRSCRACWPPAATTRRTATPTPNCSRSPTSTSPAPATTSPTSRRGSAIVCGRDFFGLKGVVEALLARLHVVGGAGGPAGGGRRSSRRAGRPSCSWGASTWATSARSTAARLDALELRGAAHGGRAGPRRPDPAGPCSSPRTGRCRRSRPSTRDLSLVVARSLPWSELSAAVTRAAGPTLEAVDFLDTFAGRQRPRRAAERPLRPPVPPPRADPDRRGGRALRQAGRRRLRLAVRGDPPRLSLITTPKEAEPTHVRQPLG